MRPRLCGWGGPSGNWTARSPVNSTNASPSHRTEAAMLKKAKNSEPTDCPSGRKGGHLS
jgi:hypothetical protein